MSVTRVGWPLMLKVTLMLKRTTMCDLSLWTSIPHSLRKAVVWSTGAIGAPIEEHQTVGKVHSSFGLVIEYGPTVFGQVAERLVSLKCSLNCGHLKLSLPCWGQRQMAEEVCGLRPCRHSHIRGYRLYRVSAARYVYAFSASFSEL